MNRREIQKLLESYELHHRAVWTEKQWRSNSLALDRFFSFNRKLNRLDAYCRSDVEDFITFRRSAGASLSTVKSDIRAVSSFYDWLIEFKELPLYNPATQVRPHAWSQEV